MAERRSKHFTIRVTANDPPQGMTLAEWPAWRAAEDERMRRELAAQREAMYELLDGATVH